MKILVITSAYPNEDDLYSNAFVHNRVLNYINKFNYTVEVCICRRKIERKTYEHEGVKIFQGDEDELLLKLEKNKYDKIIVHFLTVPMMNVILNSSILTEILVWVHGEEALSWKSRLFNWKQPGFYKYVLSNIIQLKKFKKFVKKRPNTKYIFVSNWMKDTSEKDIGVKFSNYQILPNGIDVNFFNKSDSMNIKTKVLVVRPFTSKKYATDIVVKAIEELSKEDCFSDFEISIYGKGSLLDTQVRNIEKFKNVTITKRYLSREELKKEHSEHNVFLCPTRQDAQGVSMCEAMSSGLVPISSFSTAIPEFVDHEVNGFLTNSPADIVDCLLLLNKDREKLKELGVAARKKIINKCSQEDILLMEASLIVG